MNLKIYAVALFHYPSCTHEVRFVPAHDDLEALRLGLIDFRNSWLDDEEILSEIELQKILRLGGNIHSVISEIWEHDIHIAVEQLKADQEVPMQQVS